MFERNFWRASSLIANTITPFIVAPINYILENFELSKGFRRVVRLALDLVMTILALLRNQPQIDFLAVDWTEYIPHVF